MPGVRPRSSGPARRRDGLRPSGAEVASSPRRRELAVAGGPDGYGDDVSETPITPDDPDIPDEPPPADAGDPEIDDAPLGIQAGEEPDPTDQPGLPDQEPPAAS